MQHLLPLQLLGAHQEGRIVHVEGADQVTTRLEEMGFRQGATVRMLRPGSPCIVAVGDHRMSFRCEESTLVLVEVSNGRARVSAAN